MVGSVLMLVRGGIANAAFVTGLKCILIHDRAYGQRIEGYDMEGT